MLPDLWVAFLFVYPIIKNFGKVFMHHLAMGYIIIYSTPIIRYILDEVANCIEPRIVERWLI